MVGVAFCHRKKKFEPAAGQTRFAGQRLRQILFGKLAQFNCLPAQPAIESQDSQADKGRESHCSDDQDG
jgi:hypothetical protein